MNGVNSKSSLEGLLIYFLHHIRGCTSTILNPTLKDAPIATVEWEQEILMKLDELFFEIVTFINPYLNRGVSQATHLYTPVSKCLLYFPVPGASVPFILSTLNCGVLYFLLMYSKQYNRQANTMQQLIITTNAFQAQQLHHFQCGGQREKTLITFDNNVT